jgi:predicted nucleotidyltransferase
VTSTAFGRLLEDLNHAEVRYVLVGGIAVIRHGVVRGTRDVDAVFDPAPDNLERIGRLAERWRATRQDGTALPEDALAADRSVHLATPHGDLDLLAEKTAGISFAELRERAEIRRVDGIEAPICSLGDLVAMKRAVGRERDLADLSDLRAAHGELPEP